MSRPVFYDPQQIRWRRLRRIFDFMAIAVSVLLVVFVVLVFRNQPLPSLALPDQKHAYKALKETERRHAHARAAHRKSTKQPSQVVLNQEEGIRAAFYVTWDAASFSSLSEYVHQIDLLYPEWLHVLKPDGHIQAVTEANTLFDVVQNGRVQTIDEKVMPFLKAENVQTEVFPLINNFDPIANQWTDISAVLSSSAARANLRSQLLQFLATDRYRGLNLDIEDMDPAAEPGYRQFVAELENDLHSRGLKLYLSVPAANSEVDYAYLAAHSDGVVLMNYDQHFPGGAPGSVAGQEWFTRNLEQIKSKVPVSKLICAISNYGYDWYTETAKRNSKPNTRARSVQEAWLDAYDSEASVDFDQDSSNPHFAYMDGTVRHEVWFTDAATALNEMRAAQRLGINTFALWRLGSEDRSLWSVWDRPEGIDAPGKLAIVPPGQDVDLEGNGEILRIAHTPAVGNRNLVTDPASGLITNEQFTALPTPYQISEFGGGKKQIAITFDDGPDPQWTPALLDVLKRENVKAAFFMIGTQADKFSSIAHRVYAEGHEVGNHTWTHPDISNIRRRYMQVELNVTERFFAGELGIKPLLFRPPYSIDQEPDTADQVRPLEIAQAMGYITVGDKIDPDDWMDHPRHSAEEITASVIAQLGRGNIILLHDGGGDRSETVRALPMIIHQLRAHGYEIVPVATLLGKTRADVMPPISPNERIEAKLSSIGFWFYGAIIAGIVWIFFIGDTLMSARLLLVGAAAVYDRFRARPVDEVAADAFKPPIAVLIPAFNEEKVIERTVRAVLRSNYPALRAIVIDDGSTDATCEVTRQRFAREIEEGRVVVLAKPNGGKAEALNFGLREVTEEIFLGIDADTIIHPHAISWLVPRFLDAKVAAVAGNAKVGNRVNLWTRWQALEYITSQNFERRALDALGAVTVVPGAIGAWRTAAVRAQDGYHADTVAEDADLTMRLLRAGFRVQYEDRALAYTEAPHTANGLMRQRFRWSFGIMQSVWKHRAVVKKGGALGWIAIPNIVIFQILLPLVSPFIDVMFIFGLLNYALDKHYHPETANPASLLKLIIFFLTFLVIDFLASAVAFMLERRGSDRRENYWLLAHVWLQRFAYRQLFSWVLIKTLKHAIAGRSFGWDKLDRSATVTDLHEETVGSK